MHVSRQGHVHMYGTCCNIDLYSNISYQNSFCWWEFEQDDTLDEIHEIDQGAKRKARIAIA